MRIGLLGAHPDIRGVAAALVQQGQEVSWFLPAVQIPLLVADAEPLPLTTDILPATCRHVVPIQLYHAQGIYVLGVSQECWQQPELHTRLFTLLCLFHRARPWQVLHAWSPVALAYLSVYTARFCAVPAVVSCDASLLTAREQQPFLWRWLLRHVTVLLAPDAAERVRLMASQPDLPVHDLDVTHPALGQTLTALYTAL